MANKGTKTTVVEANRRQASLLSAVEKKCLVAMARRTPAWTTPDHFTIIGLIGMLGAGLGYGLARYHPAWLVFAIIFLAINWFGDSLDGTLARVRNTERVRYGFYVDHIVDAFGILFLFGGLALSPYMSAWVAIGLLIAYLLLSIEVYVATLTVGTFYLSILRLSPTELRIILSAFTITLLFYPVVRIGSFRILLLDLFGAIVFLVMVAALLLSVVRHTRLLYRTDRAP